MMHTNIGNQNLSNQKTNYRTIFYQGITSSQTQTSKYTGERETPTTTGQLMTCYGRNKLKPLDVLINPFIGKEIKDVNTQPFTNYASYFNPVNLLSLSITRFSNWYEGIKVYDTNQQNQTGSIKAHTLNISEISLGQETDIASHYEKYTLCKNENPNDHFILYGVSRGAATTFNAFTKYQYPEVKLIILEGCFYSLDDVLTQSYRYPIADLINHSLTLFTKYKKSGPSPAKSVEQFPEGVPVIFISSKIDKIVPYNSTKKLAESLAKRQKNDVYLLTLNHSSHANYMFDHKEDHDRYENFIHAIYKKYNIPFLPHLAEKGIALLDECLLSGINVNENETMTANNNALRIF